MHGVGSSFLTFVPNRKQPTGTKEITGWQITKCDLKEIMNMAKVAKENWVEQIRDPKIECMSREEMKALQMNLLRDI